MKSQVIWATGLLVLLNGVFFGVYLFRSPGGRPSSAVVEGDASVGVLSDPRPGAAPAGVYAVTGVVREIREGGSNVMIRHETIPGYMAAMTMPFTVRDPREVASVRPGDQVTFRLLVADDESWIDSVRRVGVVEEPPKFVVEQTRVVRDVEPLEIGELMPDYPFTNEFGAQVRLSDFRGKVVGMTFIFTRCPLPDFCPRMLKNFTSVASQLAASTYGLTNWHLVTMTIDPGFDTVEVMRAYAERHQYDPKRWTFLTGALFDIDAITEQVGLVFRRQTPTSLPDHNLRTLVIDSEGRLRKIIIGNTWKPAEFLADLREASRPWASPGPVPVSGPAE
ncbi:MAG: SCO family protein [Limisphaerales bacterium]